MRKIKLPRVTVSVLGFVGVFLLTLSVAVVNLIWQARQTALAEAQAQEVRFVSGAEAALNRNLLGVDVLLASTDALLGLSVLLPEWIEAPVASRLMRGAAQQSLLVSSIALVDAEARVLASSDPGGAALALSLPAGFVAEVLAQPVSTLIVSPPVVNFASSERVLYLARSIKLANGAKVLAVAEVPVSLVTAIMIQGVDIRGLEVTLERSNGQLLASVPALEQLAGKPLVPGLGQRHHSGTALRMPARIGGAPAMVMTRPILYSDMLISASIPLDSALQDWYRQRQLMVGMALVLALMILAAGAVSVNYLARLAQARAAVAQTKATLDQALESMVSGFLLLDAEHQIVRWNRRFEAIFPWLAGTLQPLLPFRRVLEMGAKHHLPAASEAELQNWIERRMELQLNPQAPHEQNLPNGRTIQITEQRTPDGGLVIVYHDVTELRQAAAEIEQLAYFDPLTGLPNRRLLMDRLQQALTASVRSGHFGALLFLDLDHFKTINDTLGHDIGDLLLQQVAQRLKACVRDEDTVARLGGDEFVIMLEDLSSHSHEAAAMARRIGEKIIDRLNYPYPLDTHECHNTPSVGASLFDGSSLNAADLLKQADLAMYQVKAHGRNALCFFDPQMQADITARTQLEEDLHAALADAQFELYYQPQITLAGRIVGAEVLIRWNHPRRGLLAPADFIPFAEECELILPIGDWVLRTACQQLAAWKEDASRRAWHLCVNVSARQFRQPAFVARIAEVVHETGVDAHLLKLELTESLVLDNINDTQAKMAGLKAMGLKFSVNDFGTVHSSLALLTRLPLDQLKIDPSWVRNITLNPADRVLVQTIIGMARNLGLELVAVGVETRAQQEFLAFHGCTLYQGDLFGKATPLAGFEALAATVPPCTPD